MPEISREEFLEQLHNALNHLYNVEQLRKSELAALFGVAERFDTASVMRKILSEAIESLKPASSEPDTSRAWRTYESLYCCFIQQLNQQVVADQLCISSRQLRREQHNALETLADRLWQKYQLDKGPVQPASALQNSSSKGSNGSSGFSKTAETAQGETNPIIESLSWLMEAQPVKPNQLAEEIQAALLVIKPLAQKKGVTVRSHLPDNLPGVAVHGAAFNQIMVSLLGLAIQSAGSGGVQVSARSLPISVEILLQVTPANPANVNIPEGRDSLEIAAELARISGGRMYYAHGENGPFPIRLILPALEQFPVLVVDDNEDSLQLMKRYAAGTRYNVLCTRDTDQVLDLVDTLRPRIIVLDIMMPKENGWIVLARLRQHPLTVEIPIIICTILPQEKLALSLGATAYLKKPVSRQAFLQTLDEHFALQEPELP